MDDRHPTPEFAAAIILSIALGAAGFVIGYIVKAVLG